MSKYDPDKMFEMAFNYNPLKEIIKYLLERDKEINVFMSKIGSNSYVQNSTKIDVSKVGISLVYFLRKLFK